MSALSFQAIYAAWVVYFAFLNKLWIANGDNAFRHGTNALSHLSAAGFAFFYYGWETSLGVLLIVRVFFDWPLNIFRGLPLGYVSRSPKSIIDRVEKAVFGLNGILPKIIYLLLMIGVNILYKWK